MKRAVISMAAAALAFAAVSGAQAQQTVGQAAATAPANADAPWPEAWFEVFKLAPGKHEEFIRRIARADEVARAGGQPPIQIFIHSEGADWDVLLFKPVRAVRPTPEQEAAMEAKRKELKMESGAAYFVGIRQVVASHTDTKAYGPITADQFIQRLEKWRRENR